MCPQTDTVAHNTCSAQSGSSDEDCLNLNVWSPSSQTVSAPIMVFFHGGGFIGCSGGLEQFDGSHLANATGAIVVTLNYRLGALGFLSDPALRGEDSEHPSTGNYGIEDQIAALKWVRDNAAAFGGSAADVTIFGESAGANSILFHLTSPRSAGLFSRVIVESAGFVSGVTYGTLARPTALADQQGATVASVLGCTDADASTRVTCLRSQPVAAVLDAANKMGWWGPAVDGSVIPDDPMHSFATGSFMKVPIVFGTNRNEGSLFVPNPGPADSSSYQSLMERRFPGHGAAVVAQYPASSFGDSYATAAAEALGDGLFICLARKLARAFSIANAQTFRYDFAHVIDVAQWPGAGAFHGSEQPFIFGNPFWSGAFVLQSNELPLSRDMMSYWGAMAANGDPNGSGRLTWPKYDLTIEPALILDLTISTETAFKKVECDFWDSIAP